MESFINSFFEYFGSKRYIPIRYKLLFLKKKDVQNTKSNRE